MRIIPERMTAPFVDALPDLSEVPLRRQVVAGIVASALLHLCLFVIFAIAMRWMPPPREVAPLPESASTLEVEIVSTPDPEPETVPPIVANQSLAAIDRNG